MLKKYKFITIFLAMAIYVLSPYVTFAETTGFVDSGSGSVVRDSGIKDKGLSGSPSPTLYSPLPSSPVPSHAPAVKSYPPSATITYFYDGDEIENEEDSTGDMSTYLTRSVRGVVDTTGNVNVNYLISNAKDVIAQTDSSGNNITNTYIPRYL